MPPVIAAVAAAIVEVGAAIGVTVGIETATFLATLAVSTATSAALSALSSTLSSGGAGHNAGQVAQPLKLRFGQYSDGPRFWGYGRCSAGGDVKYWTTSGTDNKYLWIVVAYHDTEIDAVESFYVNDPTGLTLVPFTGDDATGTYAGFMSRYDKLGTATQTVETNLDTASAAWTSNHRLQGIAYYVWKLTYDVSKYPTGYPEPLILFRARKVWDPRLDPGYGGSGAHRLADESTWTWSQNAALCCLDYVKGVKLNGTFIGGMKCPVAGLDLDLWVAAANVCDEDVALKGGGTEKRYTVNGMVSALEDKQGVFAAMCQAMAAVPVVRNGKLGVVAGAALASATTLDDDDLAGAIIVNPSRSFQDKHNTITSVYYDRLAKDGASDIPILTYATFVASDGGITLEREVRHRFTDSIATAQRINKIMLSNEREQLTIEALWKPVAAQIPLYGTFLWTSEAAGYVEQKMRIMSRQRQGDGSFKIIARQETDDKYSWAESTEEQDPPSFVAHTSFNPYSITAPGSGDIHVSGTTIAGDGGAATAALILTADAPPSPFVIAVPTRYKLHTDSNYQAGPTIVPPETKAYITGIADGVAYDVGFAYRTNFGTSSYTTVSSVSPGTYNIDTGMIATNAVTLTTNGFDATVVSANATPSTYTNLASFTDTYTGDPVMVMVCVEISNTDAGDHLFGIRIRRDAVDLYASGNVFIAIKSPNHIQWSFMIPDTPAAGARTYSVAFSGNATNVQAQNSQIITLLTKR